MKNKKPLKILTAFMTLGCIAFTVCILKGCFPNTHRSVLFLSDIALLILTINMIRILSRDIRRFWGAFCLKASELWYYLVPKFNNFLSKYKTPLKIITGLGILVLLWIFRIMFQAAEIYNMGLTLVLSGVLTFIVTGSSFFSEDVNKVNTHFYDIREHFYSHPRYLCNFRNVQKGEAFDQDGNLIDDFSVPFLHLSKKGRTLDGNRFHIFLFDPIELVSQVEPRKEPRLLPVDDDGKPVPDFIADSKKIKEYIPNNFILSHLDQLMAAHPATQKDNSTLVRIEDIYTDSRDSKFSRRKDKNLAVSLPAGNSSTSTERLTCEISHTQNLYSLLTNRSADVCIGDITLRQLYEAGPQLDPFVDSEMSNHIGIQCVVFLEDIDSDDGHGNHKKYAVLCERAKTASINKLGIVATIGQRLHWDDWQNHYIASPDSKQDPENKQLTEEPVKEWVCQKLHEKFHIIKRDKMGHETVVSLFGDEPPFRIAIDDIKYLGCGREIYEMGRPQFFYSVTLLVNTTDLISFAEGIDQVKEANITAEEKNKKAAREAERLEMLEPADRFNNKIDADKTTTGMIDESYNNEPELYLADMTTFSYKTNSRDCEFDVVNAYADKTDFHNLTRHEKFNNIEDHCIANFYYYYFFLNRCETIDYSDKA